MAKEKHKEKGKEMGMKSAKETKGKVKREGVRGAMGNRSRREVGGEGGGELTNKHNTLKMFRCEGQIHDFTQIVADYFLIFRIKKGVKRKRK